jgi:hypothetical protein
MNCIQNAVRNTIPRVECLHLHRGTVYLKTGVPDLAGFGYFRILGLESVTVVVRTDLDLVQNPDLIFSFSCRNSAAHKIPERV